MRVRIRVVGDDPGAVRSLRDWLHRERAVRAHGDLRWGAAESPEHMGALVDVLTLAITTGFSAGQLALAIAQWRQSRHPAPVVTITRELGDGTTVRISTSDPQALAEAVRELGER